jgi:glycosyltransferase involved in cell wall biosynthesis
MMSPFEKKKQPTGAALLLELFLKSCGNRLGEHAQLVDALKSGQAVIGEHTAMFDFLSAVNRDIAEGIADSVKKSMDRRELVGIFDAVSSVAAHQFLLLPYYFALFHQNRERHLLPRITGHGGEVNRETMKLGVFTDTFDEINGVCRFIQDMSRQSESRNRNLFVHTCSAQPRVECASRKNFKPLLSFPMPLYADQPVTIPPVIEILEWADRQQFDAIHVHTPGPMGLCGLLVAKMLKIPVLGTYHTDFPQYMQNLTGDHRLTSATTGYMKWFYGQMAATFSRSREYQAKLRDFGFADNKLVMTLPGVDTDTFCPERRDIDIWEKLGVTQQHKLLYAGRVSVEKNLPFMAEAFKKLCAMRTDVSLVIAGDGPYLPAMKEALAGLPVHFLGYQNDSTLPGLYASSDLFVFPSKTDTLGQVVIEAQASGLPVLVSNVGGPKEVMDDQITGIVLPAENPNVWVNAINDLLNDTPRRQRMARTAPHRMARFSLSNTFEAFREEHFNAAKKSGEKEIPAITPKRELATVV